MSATPAAASGTRISWLSNPIVLAGLALNVVQIVARAGALYQGWFYGDDFEFLTAATGRHLSLGYLMTPHDSQLMPAGILSIWSVGQSSPYNWAFAATIIVVAQLLASLACWLMLCRVFGVRWWCLGLLSLYLFSTMTLTAYMWWAAAINQVPCQLACFLAITFHVEHLRTRRWPWAVATAAALVFGLLFYVKALLIVIPIALVSFLYFTDRQAPMGARLRVVLRRYSFAWLLYSVVAVVYVQYYVRNVPNPVAGESKVPYGELFDTLIRVSLGPSLLGGPWRWSNNNPPLGLVATPEWAVTLSWVTLGIVTALLWRAGRIDWRGGLVIVPYLLLSWVLVARGRASLIGGAAGLELRYLADAAPILVLGIGLMIAGQRGLDSPTTARLTGLRMPQVNARGVGTAVGILALGLGAVVSTVSYVHFWSGPFPAKAFTQSVIRESSQSAIHVADTPVPNVVLSGTSFPGNLPSRLFRPLGKDRVTASTVGTDLDMFTPQGSVATATVSGATSAPGPAVDCGYPVRGARTPVPLVGAPPNFFWWLEMSYIASNDGTVELSIDGHTHLAPVRKGLHRLLMQGEGPVPEVGVRSLATTSVLCVDKVTVGDLEPLSGS